MTPGVIHVTVPNWEKFNPRAGRTNYTWFRLQAGFLTDPHVFDLSDTAILLLLHVYGECCKAGKGAVELNIALTAALRKTSADQIHVQLQSIASHGLIRLHDGAIMVPSCAQDGCSTNVRTDERDVTYVPARTSAPQIKADEINLCFEEYKATVQHFKIERAASERDRIEIARAMQRGIDAETIRLAFVGARKQLKTPKFDPAQFVSVLGFLKPGRIDQLANSGAGKDDSGIDWAKIWGTPK